MLGLFCAMARVGVKQTYRATCAGDKCHDSRHDCWLIEPNQESRRCERQPDGRTPHGPSIDYGRPIGNCAIVEPKGRGAARPRLPMTTV